MKSRTNARCCAIQVLYQIEMLEIDNPTEQEVESLLAKYTLSNHLMDFTRQLVYTYLKQRNEVDELITSATYNWNLKRMTPIDRNIIRIATCEMLSDDETPLSVTINEAIELAKRYSTRTSGSFVNGVLDSIRKSYIYNMKKEKQKVAESAPKPQAEQA